MTDQNIPAQNFQAMRHAMVASQLRTTAVNDPRVVAAMNAVPREAFVPADRAAVAYVDVPVPLGHGRALNPPMATGLLLTEARILPADSVLLIGAAGGYAAALLGRLARRVVAVESDAALATAGAAMPETVSFVVGPLAEGHPADAPYDVIVIDGAVDHIPDALVAQLAEGGRLATGLVEGSVTRLAIGRKGGGGFALVAFADAEAVVLPGFARPRSFSF